MSILFRAVSVINYVSDMHVVASKCSYDRHGKHNQPFQNNGRAKSYPEPNPEAGNVELKDLKHVRLLFASLWLDVDAVSAFVI
jgi:hypothetical protein